MKRDPTMSTSTRSMRDALPQVRVIASFDHERGKVGWAHWRTRKKQATAQYRRRHLDQIAILEGLDE